MKELVLIFQVMFILETCLWLLSRVGYLFLRDCVRIVNGYICSSESELVITPLKLVPPLPTYLALMSRWRKSQIAKFRMRGSNGWARSLVCEAGQEWPLTKWHYLTLEGQGLFPCQYLWICGILHRTCANPVQQYCFPDEMQPETRDPKLNTRNSV